VAAPSAVLALVVVLLVLGGGPAFAAAPTRVTDQITDEAGVVGSDTVTVRAALDRLAERTGIRLYVVYVDDFPDWGDEYAQDTRHRSNLGRRDALLAVSVKRRTSYLSVDPYVFPLSDAAVVGLMEREVVPRIRAREWAAAATALADGLRAPWDGPGAAAIDRSRRGAPIGLLFGGGALAVSAIWLVMRRRGPTNDLPAFSARAVAVVVRAATMVVVFLVVYAARRVGTPDLAAGLAALCVVTAGTTCWAAVDGYRLPFGTVVRTWAFVGLVVVAVWDLHPLLETWIAQCILDLGGLDPALFRGFDQGLFRDLLMVLLYVKHCALALAGASLGRLLAVIR
jgi:TPM domain